MAEFDLIRQLPHSQEAEQALLGAVLLDPEKFNEIVFLKPEYFYEEQHQQIYTAMLEMYNTNRSIEIVNLVDTLTRLGLFNDGNAYKYIKLLCDTATDTLNAAECAEIIRDKAMLRALIEALRELSEEAYSEVGGADAILRRPSGASSPSQRISSTSPSTASATCCAITFRCSNSFRKPRPAQRRKDAV